MSQVDQHTIEHAQSDKPSVGRKKKQAKAAKPAVQRVTPAKPAPAPAAPVVVDPWLPMAVGLACLGVGLWAYWPTLKGLVNTWNTVPDYSHGFLVIPLAIVFLVARQKSCPGVGPSSPAVGLPLLALALAMRVAAGRFFFDFLDGWSILPWVAGSVALVGGWRLLVWSLPSIGFLWFMVPLPFGWESMASMPLQRIATKISCYVLQLLGQPAFAEGNVILLGENQLEVAQACSGLRLFISVMALAYAYVALVKRTWWEKAILILSLVPIAIVANATRIVATGLMYQFVSGEAAHKFAHDFAGYAMIPLAAAMFWGVLWYLRLLVREDEVMDMSTLVRESRT
ncbi:MAG: exosortase/archaeosortase family protein [Pirellulaceae bacterium]|nr:exosortase/archaeosortase family protein [Pirellulaceae bacterium]